MTNRIWTLVGGILLITGYHLSSHGPEKVNANVTVVSGLKATPLRKASPSQDKLFKLIQPEQSNIHFDNPIDITHEMKFLYASSMGCGGVTINDINGDGRPDIYFTNGPKQNRLYIQTDDFVFKDVTSEAGVASKGNWSTGAAILDIDNDGDLDIYVCNYITPNQLYINDGNMKFTEQAKAFDLDIIDSSHTPAFCDYDNDGDLDLYLMTNRWYHPGGFPTERALVFDSRGIPKVISKYQKYYSAVEVSPGNYRMDVDGRPDRMFRNEGGKKFKDVSSEVGLTSRGQGLSATWFDYNDDGHTDLYVGNDFNKPDQLYRNNGDGTFTDIKLEALPHTSWFSMGADFADINNDGLFDFMIADMFGTTHYKQKTQMGSMGAFQYLMQYGKPQQQMRNHLFINTGTKRFMEAGFMVNAAKSDWTWAIKARDYDCDGKVDTFVSNGMSRNYNEKDDPKRVIVPGKTQWDVFEDAPPMKEKNMAFRNTGNLKFDDTAGKTWGLDYNSMSYAAATGDLDGDGFMDLVVCNLDEKVHIYKNTGNNKHRVLVKLVGVKSNKQGLGAKVKLTANGETQVRQLTLMRGYMSGDDPKLHFGLGDNVNIDKLEVYWPSGHYQAFTNLKADQLFEITEPAGKAEKAPPFNQKVDRTLFVELSPAETGLGATHKETYFDDFKRQLLLPNQHSQLGPGMAWGDADGDGDMDLFMGNATNQSGWLYRNMGSGKFEWEYSRALGMDKKHEDMGALWFDADGDGDQDLYVVSGSVECEPGDEVLRDRLYLNDGKGNLTRSENALPDIRQSGSVVAACDYDRDGDLDLFVGSRVIPGKYPLTPDSQLLKNNQGKFTEVSDSEAAGLKLVGLVTGAVWSDVNNDGWVDLLVAVEWGPIKVFMNENGKLVERTKAAGIEGVTGWWNGINASDLDGDGDMDFVVTNFGLNTKYHADTKHPAILYYGDFHGTGKYTLVEAEYEGQVLYPIRGKSCSSNAHGFLKSKFKTYHDFAISPLQSIYTPEKLAKAKKYEINQLRSGMLINNGKGQFTFKALPRNAQTSPGFGVVMHDYNHDGLQDIAMVQNFYTPQIETGVMGGGVGMILLNKGNLKFESVRADRSGFLVPGDAKGLALCDVTGDGIQDLVVTNNDGPLQVFKNQTQGDKVIRLELDGGKGNAYAVGAQIQVEYTDGSKSCHELSQGGSYLSQGEPRLYLHAGGKTIKSLVVRWPNGKHTTHETPKSGNVKLSQP